MATEAQLERKKEKLHKALAASRGGIGEPLVSKENYKVELMLALNWYNANEDSSRLTKYGIEYLKLNKLDDYIKYFNLASDYETNQMSILMRLNTRGEYLSEDHKAIIGARLANIKAKYTEKLAEKVEEKRAAEAAGISAPSVLDRVSEVAHKHMAEIDFEIDKFVKNKSTTFSLKEYAAKNGLSGAVTKKIAEFYKRLSAELAEATTDEQLIEGYSHFSAAQLKKFAVFINSIIEDSETQVLVAKASRMPRKRKEKPAGLQVAKMQYLQEFPELGLTSIHPTKIVGANQLWIYNTKNKKLGVYYATGASGFSVKGTSLLGWDPEVSAQNGLRKPAVTIDEVMKGGKMQLQKILSKLTTVTTKMNGRINADTILLRVL
jgi:hypothetical protein